MVTPSSEPEKEWLEMAAVVRQKCLPHNREKQDEIIALALRATEKDGET